MAKFRIITSNSEAYKPHKSIPTTFSDRVSKSLLDRKNSLVKRKTTRVDASKAFPPITVKKGAQCALGRDTVRPSEVLTNSEIVEAGYDK